MIAPVPPCCGSCHRVFPPKPPLTISVEWGVDDDGRPWRWPYVLKRDYFSKPKEPWDIDVLKLTDAKINSAGEVVFDPLSYTRKASAQEMTALWDLRLRGQRFEAAIVDVQRPTTRQPSPVKTPTKRRSSSGGAAGGGVPECPPGCRYTAVVSPFNSSSSFFSCGNAGRLVASLLRRHEDRRLLAAWVRGPSVVG